ncbi:MAG: AAA family ATPase [candidate division WOR-3 bacterium]|nr:MAG: AAA family ATPase [candidate division WOR-3 bacterium]
MRIKRIHIRKYGPIDELTVDTGNFEVIYGLNEAGKTALVEVLVHILFKRTAANLRYDKPESVSIEIEEDGRTENLPQKKIDIELPVGDVANLMYVQASESTVFGSRGETRFWDGIKSMLSRVGAGVPFTKLDEYIFDAIDLQPVKGDWKRSKATIIENELRRKEELGRYIEKIGEIGTKESRLANMIVKNDALKKQINEIDQYKNYLSYADLVKLHNSYGEIKTAVQDYERYKYDYLGEWQKLDLERNARLGEGVKVQEIESEVEQLEKDVGTLQEIEEYIAKEGLKNYTEGSMGQPSTPSIIIPFIVMLLAAGFTALGVLNFVPLLPPLILFTASLFLLIYVLYMRSLAQKLLSGRDQWLEKARMVFPEIGSIDELSGRIEKNQEALIKKRTLVEEKKRIIVRMASARSADVIEKEIALIRSKTGLAEISDLEGKLLEKRKIEGELNKVGTRLAGLLQENDPKKWERMISERKVKKPANEPDVTPYRDLLDEQKDLQRLIDDLAREIKLFRDVEQARVNVPDDHSAFVEFDRLEKKLRDHDLEKDAAFAAREILKSMSGELDEFIDGIMHGKDSLSEYYKAVTGRYTRVIVKNEQFIVEDRSGKRYTFESLSSGAQDQLLLCFRMAALTRVYANGTFMILDDAFIFADWQRRERLVALVRDFVERGNQVIYLTSDDHTRDLFGGCGARVTVLK